MIIIINYRIGIGGGLSSIIILRMGLKEWPMTLVVRVNIESIMVYLILNNIYIYILTCKRQSVHIVH